jgi:hypothetical protein
MRRSCCLLAIALTSCFPVAPLADCADPGGLYVAHHVCMPPAGPAIALGGEPRRMVVADFDHDGAADDLAVLLAPDVVQVYAGLDGEASAPSWAGALRGDSGEVEGIAGVRYFDSGAHGDDLFAWTVDTGASPDASGQLIGLRNGGDLFTGEAPVAVTLHATVDGDPDSHPCPLPNAVVGLGGPAAPYAGTLAITCSQSTLLTLAEPDVIVLRNEPGTPLADQAQLGARTDLADAHAAVSAQLDSGPRLVVAYRPPGEDHDRIAILSLEEGSTEPAIKLEPRFGFIDGLVIADLDADGDLDIVSLHTDEGGLGIVAQDGSLRFAEPDFYSPGAIVTGVVAGDFTGDGGIDLAVAHEVANSRDNAISLFVRSPDLSPGELELELVRAGTIAGAIVDLAALDVDGDGRTDLAAAVLDGSDGSLQWFRNLSPGDVPGR